MRRIMMFLVIFGVILGVKTAVANPAPTLTRADYMLYLPINAKPSQPPSDLPRNPSFEEGWTNLPPAPGNLINQQPNEWTLSWVQPGQPLYDSSDLSGGVPECVHKLASQLPPDEQPGGPNALILDGTVTYKMFHAGAPFGSELRQTMTGLPPGSSWRLVVPVQVHLHGDTDPYSAEVRVQVNGAGSWVNAGTLGDRNWNEIAVPFTADQNGEADIVIQVKSKWPRAKDFFMDALRLESGRGSGLLVNGEPWTENGER